jgi:hypothetical protein
MLHAHRQLGGHPFSIDEPQSCPAAHSRQRARNSLRAGSRNRFAHAELSGFCLAKWISMHPRRSSPLASHERWDPRRDPPFGRGLRRCRLRCAPRLYGDWSRRESRLSHCRSLRQAEAKDCSCRNPSKATSRSVSSAALGPSTQGRRWTAGDLCAGVAMRTRCHTAKRRPHVAITGRAPRSNRHRAGAPRTARRRPPSRSYRGSEAPRSSTGGGRRRS